MPAVRAGASSRLLPYRERIGGTLRGCRWRPPLEKQASEGVRMPRSLLLRLGQRRRALQALPHCLAMRQSALRRAVVLLLLRIRPPGCRRVAPSWLRRRRFSALGHSRRLFGGQEHTADRPVLVIWLQPGRMTRSSTVGSEREGVHSEIGLAPRRVSTVPRPSSPERRRRARFHGQ